MPISPHKSLVDNLRDQMRHPDSEGYVDLKLFGVALKQQSVFLDIPGANCSDEGIIAVQFLNG